MSRTDSGPTRTGRRQGSRQAARELIVRTLYSQQAGGTPDMEGEGNTYLHQAADLPWSRQILNGLPPHLPKLDQAIGALSSRQLSEIDRIELCILRLACYELAHCPDIPWKVIVTEAVRLTRLYCAPDSYRFVNGLAEKLSLTLRPEAAADMLDSADSAN